MTCAPQSASWRTAVGPARCAVRSRTEMWDRGRAVMGVSSGSAGIRPHHDHERGKRNRPEVDSAWTPAVRIRLASFEGGLPLFHEGAAAFLVILAVEAGLHHVSELLVFLLRFRLADLARRCLADRDG